MPVYTQVPLGAIAPLLQCEPVAGLGFRRGSYRCVCRRGFYFPDIAAPQRFYNGSYVEEEYEKLALVSTVEMRVADDRIVDGACTEKCVLSTHLSARCVYSVHTYVFSVRVF